MVLIALLDHYPTMRPSVRRIAALSGLAERTVREAIGRLKKKEVLSVETIFLQPNIYHINVDFFSHLTIVPPAPPAGDAPPPLQEMHPPPAGDASKGNNIRREEEEKNIGDSQSNTTSSRDQEEEDPDRSTKKGNPQIKTFSAANREGKKEREQTDLERMVIETEEKEFADLKKSLEREEKKEKARRREIVGDENNYDEMKEKAIAFGDAFFESYPKSDGEIGARDLIEQMWRNGKINKDNWESILDAVENQKYGGILAKFDRFVPLAKNWLRDGRWLDKKPARKSKKSKKKKHMVGEYDPESANDGPGFGWVDYDPDDKPIKKHMVGEYNAERANKRPRVGWDWPDEQKKKKHMVGEYNAELDGSTKIGW
jgi:hypothetical protein